MSANVVLKELPSSRRSSKIKSSSSTLCKNLDALKEVVIEGTLSDQYMPATSASLDYLKYEDGTVLPSRWTTSVPIR